MQASSGDIEQHTESVRFHPLEFPAGHCGMQFISPDLGGLTAV